MKRKVSGALLFERLSGVFCFFSDPGNASSRGKSALWQNSDVNIFSSLFSLQISEHAEDVAEMHRTGFMASLLLHTVLPQI